jgi:hypothetical protein
LLLTGQAGYDPGPFVGSPQFGFGDEAIGQRRVTQVQLHDQFAGVRDARRQRDMMTVNFDLLVGNLEGFRALDHGAECIDGDGMEIIAKDTDEAVRGDETEREKCALHG